MMPDFGPPQRLGPRIMVFKDGGGAAASVSCYQSISSTPSTLGGFSMAMTTPRPADRAAAGASGATDMTLRPWADVARELGQRFAQRAGTHDETDSFVAENYA